MKSLAHVDKTWSIQLHSVSSYTSLWESGVFTIFGLRSVEPGSLHWAIGLRHPRQATVSVSIVQINSGILLGISVFIDFINVPWGRPYCSLLNLSKQRKHEAVFYCEILAHIGAWELESGRPQPGSSPQTSQIWPHLPLITGSGYSTGIKIVLPVSDRTPPAVPSSGYAETERPLGSFYLILALAECLLILPCVEPIISYNLTLMYHFGP